jgi:5-methylcytosine-specific restriction endonuclease McrBC regulatory subunit McrC
MYAKFMRQHGDEMEELYEKYLTKAMKAKLDATQKAKVKAAILEKAILAEVDHRAKNIEKDLTKEIREIAKKL